MTTAFLSLALLTGLASAPAAQVLPDDADRSRPEMFEGAEHYRWQRPDFIGLMVGFREGDKVVDLGAGRGFYSNLLIHTVFDTGRVYALESDPEAVEYLKSGEIEDTWGNFFPMLFDGRKIEIPDAEIDVVISINYWHRLERSQEVSAEVQRILKPGGRLVVIDWHDGDVELAPAVEKRLDRGRLLREMEAAGWLLTTESHTLKYQYFFIFTKKL
jgi:ubiquinone/menaquinone biosynthesis C-methylase UbiE